MINSLQKVLNLKYCCWTSSILRRDAILEMAAAGMEGFRVHDEPDRLDKILKRLAKIQSKVYK